MAKISLPGLSVLLVDDVNFVLDTVKRQMSGLGLKNVFQAKNGQEGLAILRDPTADVKFVISDFNMPVMHGLEFLKAIRSGSAGVERAMPFAMLTGYSEKHLVDMALALDVNAFLVKPMSKKGLEERLDKMLRLVIAENWLKDAEVYAAVNVDAALDGIRMPQTDDVPAQPRRVYLKAPKKRPAPRKVPEAIDWPSGERRVDLDAVPGNAVLSRNIFTEDGRLLLAAGSKLSPRVVSVLIDLHSLGHPTRSLWIES